jgi:hypothetical protein
MQPQMQAQVQQMMQRQMQAQVQQMMQPQTQPLVVAAAPAGWPAAPGGFAPRAESPFGAPPVPESRPQPQSATALAMTRWPDNGAAEPGVAAGAPGAPVPF